MKKTVIFLVLIFIIVGLTAQNDEIYSRVKINLQGKEISKLAAVGIDLSEGEYKAGVFLITELGNQELEAVEAAGFTYELLISDMTSYYLQRAQAESDLRIERNPANQFPVPQNWGYGTMGGFYTYQQVVDKLDFMASTWPHLITVKQPIDPMVPSVQGRPIWYVKISDNPNESEDEPQVLYTSLIHAREGIGVQQMIYYMLWLLENYETNELAKTIVDNTEMYFVPVVNPDGYLHNQQTSPGGGGMWRKNRRSNAGGSFGVDINRNFGYKWGLDNTGSSPNPSSDTYRGTGPFSEPETDNLRAFCETKNFGIALNYHSYSNLLLYPWGYTNIPSPDDALFHAYATLMTRDSKYVIGPGSTTIYATNGGSDDYMYGDTVNKNAIFSFTPELGSTADGFWPAISRIIPICQENMIQNVYAALLVGSYGKATETAPTIIGQKLFHLPFKFQRLGLKDTESYTVSIEPLDAWIIAHGEPKEIGSLQLMQQIVDSIAITLHPSIASGASFKFLLKVNNGSYTISDTITKRFGATSVVFSDNGSSMANWTSTGWGLSTSQFVSPPSSITDSPSGNYQNNAFNTLTQTQAVFIPNTSFAKLNFWAKWDIETGWDYVQVQIRQSGSITWTPLQGKFTKTGGSNQAPGQPLYDGNSNWVYEEIDLSAYAGKNIQLRFLLKSDGAVTADGFYFDDLKITVLDIETQVGESKETQILVYPNPGRGEIKVQLTGDNKQLSFFEVYDMNGNLVRKIEARPDGEKSAIETFSLAPGVYMIKVNGTNISARIVVH